MSQWDIEKTKTYYSVSRWSDGYFDIDEAGRMRVYPQGNGQGISVALADVVEGVQQQGLTPPLFLHFTDILQHRVATLCSAFENAMRQRQYPGQYTVVYPIKVNQQRCVVEAIASASPRVGLEAGSKTELLAVLASARADDGMVVCNGYKDHEFIRIAMTGQRMGYRVFMVIEKLSELEKIIQVSSELGIKPLLGARVRLATIGAGKWQNTGGSKSKFGLSAAQMVELVQRLRSADLLDCLGMLHFHMGSQIANLDDIRHGIEECGQYYASLRQMDVAIDHINIGGGLAVDYDGTASQNSFSMNYSMSEYADTIVQTLSAICQQQNLPYPDIISESGRALTAHHAVLVTSVVDREHTAGASDVPPVEEQDPETLRQLLACAAALSADNVMSQYEQANSLMRDLYRQFSKGRLGLPQRARAEAVFTGIGLRARELLQQHEAPGELLAELDTRLADKLFCNYSIFQSIPDVWALDQVFPILPLTGLQQAPTRQVIIEDITCDSDGRIDHYVDSATVGPVLGLPEAAGDEPDLLGIFLVGAYQEILGDMHNLFGDEHSVDIAVDHEGFSITCKRPGNTVSSILGYVHYDPAELKKNYREKIAALEHLGTEQKTHCLAILEQGLETFTYLQNNQTANGSKE